MLASDKIPWWKLPCAVSTWGLLLKVSSFCGSVEILAWAKANECPWDGEDMLVCLGEGAGQGAEVGAGARLPVERVDV